MTGILLELISSCNWFFVLEISLNLRFLTKLHSDYLSRNKAKNIIKRIQFSHIWLSLMHGHLLNLMPVLVTLILYLSSSTGLLFPIVNTVNNYNHTWNRYKFDRGVNFFCALLIFLSFFLFSFFPLLSYTSFFTIFFIGFFLIVKSSFNVGLALSFFYKPIQYGIKVMLTYKK